MARMKLDDTRKLEEEEGVLALLGNSLVLLELVEERLRAALRSSSSMNGVLSPALNDVHRIARNVRQSQHNISGLDRELARGKEFNQ